MIEIKNINEAIDLIETPRKENEALKQIVAELDSDCKYCANRKDDNSVCAENSDCEHCKADCPCKDCHGVNGFVWNSCCSGEQEDTYAGKSEA